VGDLPRSDDALLLTTREAASRLSIGRSTLYELIAAGEVEVVRIGRSVRVPTATLAVFVERRRQEYEHASRTA
jgi:excisionase family DNA binding protein